MIGIRVTRMFIDKRAILTPKEQAQKRVLSKQGAFLRGAARRLIRKRRGAARPGQPPHTHTGALKHAILFEVGTDSVVIGPAASSIGELGALHEFGGSVAIKAYRQKNGRAIRAHTRKYPPRPFMWPAYDEVLPRLPAFWEQVI
jgi:phage gpG-like protein